VATVTKAFIDGVNDNTSILFAYNTSAVAQGNYASMTLDAVMAVGTAISATAGGLDITCNNTGNYLVRTMGTLTKTTNTIQSQCNGKMRLLINGSQTGGITYTYHESSTVPTTSMSSIYYLALTAGDKLRLQFAASPTTVDLSTTINGCSILVGYLNSSRNGQSNVKFLQVRNTAATAIGTSYTDIPFDTTVITNAIYTLASPTVTVTENGFYYIYLSIVLTNTTAATNSATGQILFNHGNGYQTLGTNFITSTNFAADTTYGITTITAMACLYLASGWSVKVQLKKASTSTVTNLTTGNSVINVLKGEPADSVTPYLNDYGSYFTRINSFDTTTYNSTSFITKCILCTKYVASGNYLIRYYYKASATGATELASQILDVSGTQIYTQNDTINTTVTQYNGEWVVGLEEGVYAFDLGFALSTGYSGTVTISYCALSFYRIV
jgi:hypothetical protein